MFNLLVAGSSWEQNSDTMSVGRTFEYTDDELKTKFKPSGTLNIGAVINLPCLFMSENGGSEGEPPARVGRITRIRTNSVNYTLDYIWDPDIPPIPNAELMIIRTQLDIGEFEFSRTHWAIKEADLFETLYKRGIGKRAQPKVFTLKESPVNESLVAVMMPFDRAFDHVYTGIRAAASTANMICKRVDDIWENDHIIQDVIDLIVQAKVVVCDLTGRNPNVFYEMGIAHALGKDVIMLTQNPSDVPFDVTHIRYIKYLGNEQGVNDMQAQMTKRLTALTER